MTTGKILPLTTLFLVNFMWGFDFIAIDYMVTYISPAVMTFTRLLLGALILVVIVLVKEKGLHINKADWPRVFICGATGMALYFTIETIGVEKTSGALASLIMATVPIFGMLADRILFKNRITPVKVIGIIASIIGVAALVMGAGGDSLGGNAVGICFMFGAAMLWTFFIVYTKPLFAKYSLVTILTGMFFSGTVVTLPMMLLSNPSQSQFTPNVIIVLTLTTVICLIVGEFFYIYSIGKLSVTVVSLFENVLPLVTVLFSFFIFGEMLTGLQLIGGAIIIISVTMISLRE